MTSREDAWIAALSSEVASLSDYLAVVRRLRSVFAPHVRELLALGVSVVLDFAGNTVPDRQWVRRLGDDQGVVPVLHYLHVDEATCLDRIHRRNDQRPVGLFFGVVSDALVAEVNRHVVPPTTNEGLRVIEHDANGLVRVQD